MNNEPRVVIIGGGFGGLCAARGLVGAPLSVTLIDKRNYHFFRPRRRQRFCRNKGDTGVGRKAITVRLDA